MIASDANNKWLAKAAKDLRLAKQIFSLGDEYYDHCAFLCQQSVEKSLKAFLSFHKIRIKKIHNIQKITQSISSINKELAGKLQPMEVLTDYAVKYLYPEADLEELSSTEIGHALKLAEEAFNLIKNSL